MNLVDVIREIERAAAAQPAVHSVCRQDVFRINGRPDVRYAVFAWLQGMHYASLDTGLWNFNFTLFYVDRLTADGGNLAEVQAAGMEVLRNILLALQERGVYTDGTPSFEVFRQRFVDECGGVFCRVTFEVPQGGACAEEYDDLRGREVLTI